MRVQVPRLARRALGGAVVSMLVGTVAAAGCGREEPSREPGSKASQAPATTASPGTTKVVGRTTTTFAGTTLPRPGGTTATTPGSVHVEGDLARRYSALCVELRQIAEGPLPPDRVDAAGAQLPATFASLPVPPDHTDLSHQAAGRFADGTAALLAAPDAGQGAGRGAVPSPLVWPAGADAGLEACFVRDRGDRAPLSVQLPPVTARPGDEAALDALLRTELAVVDPFGYLDLGSQCVAEQVSARRGDFDALVKEHAATGWAEGMGRLAGEVATACGAAVSSVAADGTGSTLFFLAPPGTFASGTGPKV